jgi:hypothetical protein
MCNKAQTAATYFLAAAKLSGVLLGIPFHFIATIIGAFANMIWLGLVAGWRS